MGKAGHLHPCMRARAAALHKQGWTQMRIVEALGCSRGAVQNALKLAAASPSLKDRQRPGRPRKSNQYDDRRIRRLSEADRKKTAPVIKKEFEEHNAVSMNRRTYQRRLVEFGLLGCVARKKPYISAKNRKHRLQWAKERVGWESHQWQKIVWSDESRFKKCGSDGWQYVRRRIGEEYLPKCTQGTVKHGGGCIMVWAAFDRSGVGPIVKVEGIMDAAQYVDILQSNLGIKYANSRHKKWVFQ